MRQIYPAANLDPDLAEIVELYVAEMPDKIAQFRAAWEIGDDTRLRRLCHQMKGSAPSYGFPELGNLANGVELAIAEGRSRDLVSSKLEGLLESCACVALPPAYIASEVQHSLVQVG